MAFAFAIAFAIVWITRGVNSLVYYPLVGFPHWLYPLHTFHARYPISVNDKMVTLMVDSVDNFAGMIACELVLWLQ
jgi:hypothetical protein